MWSKFLQSGKFRQGRDMRTQKKIISSKEFSTFSGIIAVQCPRVAGSPDNTLKQDPGKDPQDPATSFVSDI